MSFSACGSDTDSNTPTVNVCDEAFNDISSSSFLKEKIIDINGYFNLQRHQDNLLLQIKKVVEYDAHGPVVYYCFYQKLASDSDPEICDQIVKNAYRCNNYFIGSYTCLNGATAQEEVAYWTIEGNTDFEIIWPRN